MMKKIWKIILLLVGVSALLIGCTKENDKNMQETDSAVQGEEEANSAISEEAKSEEPVAVEDLSYISNDGNIEIMLPNATWECTEDTGKNIIITSQEGVINIIYNEGQAVSSQLVENKEAYESMIRGVFFGIEFETLHFQQINADGRRGYNAVIQYAEGNPDRYMVGAANYGEADGYTVAATLYVEDEELLSIVEDSVFAMKVLP